MGRGIVGLLIVIGASWSAGAAVSVVVSPTFETEPVASAGDAADDVALWSHPTNPERSLIVATDKKAGLLLYGFDGRRRGSFPVGKINNIDSRPGFFGRTILAGSNRSTNAISFFGVDPNSLQLIDLGSVSIGEEPYGLCMGRNESTRRLTVVVTMKTGDVAQWDVQEDAQGRVSTRPLGRVRFGGQTEGCVVDDRNGNLFVSEETVGIWRMSLARRSAPVAIDRVAPQGHLVADVEGLTIYHDVSGRAFLLASSQGDNSFHVYEAEGSNRHLGRFQVGPGRGIDGVTGTDGIDVIGGGLHPAFPNGVFIAQDDVNEEGRGEAPQNFKLVDWRVIRQALGLR